MESQTEEICAETKAIIADEETESECQEVKIESVDEEEEALNQAQRPQYHDNQDIERVFEEADMQSRNRVFYASIYPILR